MRIWIAYLLLFPFWATAQIQVVDKQLNKLSENPNIVVGADRPSVFLPLLEGKRVGVIANHTSLMKEGHLVDYLITQKVKLRAVFAPEHGFRGDAGAGEKINDGKDIATGLPIRSLYGATKKPTPEMLSDIDILVFDMQDVGARFYTYLSTLHYALEAAAEKGIPFVVLDRPNPNGFYTDGPILEEAYKSFVGMHPIPLVHGMTLGELARMINGEGWLKNGVKADLTVVPCANYKRTDLYNLPVNPSPNLTSMESVYLYPSLCLFEPTVVSIGRGTKRPFEMYGHPEVHFGTFTFTPKSIKGMAPNPKHKGKKCYGVDLKAFGGFYFQTHRRIYLDWLMAAFQKYEAAHPGEFFKDPAFFDKLVGNSTLRKQMQEGLTVEAIRETWIDDLKAFAKRRKPYLLYA